MRIPLPLERQVAPGPVANRVLEELEAQALRTADGAIAQLREAGRVLHNGAVTSSGEFPAEVIALVALRLVVQHLQTEVAVGPRMSQEEEAWKFAEIAFALWPTKAAPTPRLVRCSVLALFDTLVEWIASAPAGQPIPIDVRWLLSKALGSAYLVQGDGGRRVEIIFTPLLRRLLDQTVGNGDSITALGRGKHESDSAARYSLG